MSIREQHLKNSLKNVHYTYFCVWILCRNTIPAQQGAISFVNGDIVQEYNSSTAAISFVYGYCTGIQFQHSRILRCHIELVEMDMKVQKR